MNTLAAPKPTPPSGRLLDLDRRFKYVNAAQTDLRITFARVRKELAEKKA